ncbi:M23 family metallopeptidase [Tessaracoccus antarcticus]|uniref:M23 family metallopeptidase n=2 Tax=Tessaracoccus antarcticus TaxID=2479848 RepID=A0A3M0FZ08_9ACTN|nr:M23 family metallopeptidase [Tessaracoccus antarcticus]
MPTTGLECQTTPADVGSELGLTADAARVMRCVAAGWPQIRTIGGLRPGDPRDHGTGRAVDVMIPHWSTPAGAATGQEIAEWARTNATRLGVTYVIWQRRIWSVARTNQGWRNCSEGSCYDGPNPSSAHLNHVHISVNGTTNATALSNNGGDGAVVLPVAQGTYRITAGFGQTGTRWASIHTGLDFAAPTGTPIRAVTAGTVTYAQASGGPYGNLTTIRAADGTEVWYAHQSRINVRLGQAVAAGRVIGAVGATGNVTGPHLHLEVRINNHPTNPRTWLQQHNLNP